VEVDFDCVFAMPLLFPY